MEGASEGDNRNNDDGDMNDNGAHRLVNLNNSNEGQSKPKRQMKTPFQLETLEKAYVLDAYPSESIRAELSEKLGLSDRQLQMWFCHRRLKDKKDGGPAKKQRKMAPAAQLPESPVNELRAGPAGAGPGSDYGSGSGSGSSPFGPAELRNVVSRSLGDDVSAGRRYYEPPLPLAPPPPPPPPTRESIMERAITIVEAQLGEPLREDGPVLGIEFDPLPPDAFGALIAAEHHKRSRFESKSYDRHDARPNKASQRALHEYPFLPDSSSTRNNAYAVASQSHLHTPALDGPTSRALAVGNEQIPRHHGAQGHSSRVRVVSQPEKQGVAFPSLPSDANNVPQKDHSFAIMRASPQVSEHPIISPESSYMMAEGQVVPSDTLLRLERKRKSEEARIAREIEAHEIRVRKELEKQDILRRKHEERLKREMERQDRERRKEEERLMREKQREEERLKREQRREIERREKFLQKECLRAEKKKQKEELRKEREEVRRKAAIEKATARRIARESMELIEDEQLELMEMAAARKGLPSIVSLDHDTLQSLESFKNFLSAFPPKSVQMKRPFSIQPWNHSEENIGNLLMVWRFFITFADVLELWPFTLDEFVQAFHDYDSRLLGEIHLALLKLIIKDIEDVARTPSGLGMNQNGAANPGGGHPEIVEGAYTWGFDICNWQRLLNPLTWPEIFRQLALSAGFGPRLKKRSMAWPYLRDNDEGKSCEDVISTLRSGSAAENAFTVMQEKGLLNPRKSRHRLTPGTVKFAAFHVLSLEGSTGLTVLDLAEKIQKSGLRDLTTSKTPEASISVALTRDAKLFERIAPSTYRVRAAYRKDPSDAEAILSAARKKVQVFENGFLATEDADDVERDDDSECDDVDEDPEVDDLATPSRPITVAEHYNEVNTCSGSVKEILSNDVALDLQNEFDQDFPIVGFSAGKDANCPVVATPEQFVAVENTTSSYHDEENMEIDESKSGESWIQGLTEGEYSDLSVEERLNALVALVRVANEGNSVRLVLEDRLEAANFLKKQMWTEAQLDKIRLKEENIIRYDFPSSVGVKAEMHLARSAADGSQSPLPDVVNRITDMSPSTADIKKPVHDLNSFQPDLNSLPFEKTPVAQDLSAGPDNFLTQQFAFASKRSRSQLKSYIAHRAEEMYVYRSLPLGQDRRHNRYWQFVASASKNDPGSGRIFVELEGGNWRLIDSEEAFDALLMSLDTRGIRESHLRVMLQKVETSFRENVRRGVVQYPIMKDTGAIVVKGETDEIKPSPGFPAGFDSPGSTICGSSSDMDLAETSHSFRIELGRNENEKRASLRRYQDFQKWMWKECFNSSALRAMNYGEKRCTELLDICDICLSPYYYEDSHCFSCHQTFATTGNNFMFSQHVIQCKEKRKSDPGNIHASDTSLPFGSRLLKALLALIEASVPPEALQSFWTEDLRKTWGVKLNDSLTSEQLLQILTMFESVMKRDFLASRFTPTEELLGSSNQSGAAQRDHSDPGSVPLLPWVPHTSAAVALRLFELDASVAYIPEEKPEPVDDRAFGEYIKAPTRFAPPRNDKDIELAEVGYSDYAKEENLSQFKSSRNNYKRGRGSREQSRGKSKSQRRHNGSKSSSARRNAKVNTSNRGQALSLPGTALKQGSGARGPRTVRKRRPETKAVEEEEKLQVRMVETPSSPESGGESPRNMEEEEWDDENANGTPVRDDYDYDDNNNVMDDDNIMDDDNVREEEEEEEYEQQGNWDVGFNGVPSKWNIGGLMEASDEDMDGYDDDGGNGAGGFRQEGDSEGDVDADASEESDEMPERIGNTGDVDEEGSDLSASEDYSD